jgi:hypothetical protein
MHFKIMKLTTQDIEQDIAAFEARLSAARDKISKLPEGYLPYREYKKREHARRVLNDEIDHVENLIRIAMSYNETDEGINCPCF